VEPAATASRRSAVRWFRILCSLLAVFAAIMMLEVRPASASCAAGQPLRSAHAFPGVVTETRSGGRLALVRTDDGRVVSVRGGETRVVTSVDRTYMVGARYEFHPTNAASPYEDNACTATRLLGGSPSGTERTATDDQGAGADSGSSDGESTSTGVAATVGLILALVAVAIGRRRGRLVRASRRVLPRSSR
jgi:hypothetical protein